MPCGLLDHVQDHITHGHDVVSDADVDDRARRGPSVEPRSQPGSGRRGRFGRSSRTGRRRRCACAWRPCSRSRPRHFRRRPVDGQRPQSARRRRRTGIERVRRRRGARSCRPVSSRWARRWTQLILRESVDDRQHAGALRREEERQRVPFGGRSRAGHCSCPRDASYDGVSSSQRARQSCRSRPARCAARSSTWACQPAPWAGRCSIRMPRSSMTSRV